MDCNCPQSTTLTEITSENCGVDLKQIQRLAFQRIDDAGKFETATNDILDLANWQAFQTANDNTKIVVTPIINADPVIEPGEAITVGGGDNSTLNGVEEIEGTNPARFSCMFKSLSSLVERQLKELACERFLRVYFILQGGRIAVHQIVAGTPGNYHGFDCYSVFVSDRGNQGFGTKDTHSMSLSLPAGYSEQLEVVKPNFNPLTEL